MFKYFGLSGTSHFFEKTGRNVDNAFYVVCSVIGAALFAKADLFLNPPALYLAYFVGLVLLLFGAVGVYRDKKELSDDEIKRLAKENTDLDNENEKLKNM